MVRGCLKEKTGKRRVKCKASFRDEWLRVEGRAEPREAGRGRIRREGRARKEWGTGERICPTQS